MSDREEAGRDVKNRMSERFSDDETDGNDEPGDRSESAAPSESVGPSERSGRSEPAEDSEPSDRSDGDENDESDLNVKEDWKGRYMYIPPEIHAQFDDEYERLRYECGRDLDWKPKKNKHYYPIVATKGIDAVAEMDPNEFADAVASLGYFGEKDGFTNE